MSDKPNLPLNEISTYDAGQLKKTEVADKSGVTSQDKLLATIAKGNAHGSLKHAEPKVKTWMPTKEDLEADAKEKS